LILISAQPAGRNNRLSHKKNGLIPRAIRGTVSLLQQLVDNARGPPVFCLAAIDGPFVSANNPSRDVVVNHCLEANGNGCLDRNSLIAP
jgi:hypothetical protein